MSGIVKWLILMKKNKKIENTQTKNKARQKYYSIFVNNFFLNSKTAFLSFLDGVGLSKYKVDAYENHLGEIN